MLRKTALLLWLSTMVALSAVADTKSWTGAVNNLWSVGGNWNGGLAPIDGDSLVFPDGASNRNMTNDLSGLDLGSINFSGTVSSYSAVGNAITLSGGLMSSSVTWSIPTTLTASQTWSVGGALTSSIDLNGHTLAFWANSTILSGSLVGSGTFNLFSGYLNFTGTSTFAGTFSVNAGLNVAGSISGSTLTGGGVLTGAGTLPTTTLASIVRPGHDPAAGGGGDIHSTGVLATGTFSATGGAFVLDLAGPAPGTGYDQLAVTGGVTLVNPQLLVAWPAGPPAPGQTFVIVSNDGSDPVNGIFSGLPSGSSFTVAGGTFSISYTGGDGNDIVLTTLAGGPKSWTGAVNNLWSVGGNWNGGVAPVDGDSLVFPDGASNRNMTNDLSGLDLGSINFTATVSSYSAVGNALTLNGGLTSGCHCVTWGIPTTLSASQSWSILGALTSSIDLNGHTLAFWAHSTTLSGSLVGSGTFNLFSGYLNFTGTSTFAGTFSVNAGLNVAGSISGSTLTGGGVLTGAGTLAAATLAPSIVRPGHDPAAGGAGDNHSTGVLTTGTLSAAGGAVVLDLAGPAPGTGYDQLAVTGGVTLVNPQLLVAWPAGPPAPGQTFVIVSNDGSDPVNGIFSGLPSGSSFTVAGVPFTITYTGGDGNDIVLTTLAGGPKSWTGAVNNLWSVGGNWSGGVAPVDGDSLAFPDGAANRNMSNDLSGLDLAAITFSGTGSSYSAGGNAITLSGGLTSGCCLPVTWSIPTTLTASQTWSVWGALTSSLDLNGHTLTFEAFSTTFSGSLVGSGAFNLANGNLNFTGTSAFAGTFSVNAGLNVAGSISGSTLTGGGILTGAGTIPATTLASSLVYPGHDPGASCCGHNQSTGVLTTGTFSATGGALVLDFKGPAPGTGFDQLAVIGGVTLNGAQLLILVTGGLPAPGQTFLIVSNDGADPIAGTFAGLSEGSTFTILGARFGITYAGGDGNDVVVTALADTATAQGTSKNPTVSGEAFTLTATVTSSFGTPAGTVHFMEGTTTLATASLNGSGTASSIVQLPAGTHSIIAAYDGAGMFAASASAPLTQTVTKATSLAVPSAASTPVVHGQPVSITVQASAAPPATGIPTGAVTIGAAGISANGALSAGQFTANLLLAPGVHTVATDYAGDANFLASTGTDTVEVLADVLISPATEAINAPADTTVELLVTLSGPSNQTVTVDYATQDDTALAGSDYVAATGTLVFAPGTTSQTISITILGDNVAEPAEAFGVVLSNPQHAAIGQADAVIQLADGADIPTLGTLALLLCSLALGTMGVLMMKR